MRLELFIPALPKLPNRLLGAHWRTRSENAKKWKRLVGDALAASDWYFDMALRVPPIPWTPLKKARITFTRCSPRSCDADNLCGSFKAVLDALVFHGVIENDTAKHVTCDYVWEKVPTKQQGVRIEVVDAQI